MSVLKDIKKGEDTWCIKHVEQDGKKKKGISNTQSTWKHSAAELLINRPKDRWLERGFSKESNSNIPMSNIIRTTTQSVTEMKSYHTKKKHNRFERSDLIKDLGLLCACNLVVKPVLFLYGWVTFIYGLQSGPWLIIPHYLPPTLHNVVNERHGGRRGAGTFHSNANANICLSPPCRPESWSKHLPDRWRHSHTEAGTRVTHNPQCNWAVCVCACERPNQRVMTPHWFRSCGVEMEECR